MIRSGKWKLISGLGSGGFSQPSSIKAKAYEAAGQLYNLRQDLSETNNLYLAKRGVVMGLHAEMQRIVGGGDSH
jgi:arylsulfatase A